MRLLCHRGYWEGLEDQNTLRSLKRALRNGLGIETDVRDCDGRLVISHDIPRSKSIFLLEQFLEAYIEIGNNAMLAINIKADGIQELLKKTLNQFGVKNYFVFDMSVPDTLGYLKLKMPTAVRISEYEDGDWLMGRTDIVWLDAFEKEWYEMDVIVSWLDSGKHVCIVSPELHGRPHLPLWTKLLGLSNSSLKDIYLCTDLVPEAMEVFDCVEY